MRKTVTIILLGLACATPMLAQNPPKPPDPATMAQRRVQFLTTLLSLNGAQQQQATTIFTNAASTHTTIHENMKTARQNLANAVRNNDTAVIDQLAATIGNLTTQATATHAKAQAAFFQILTPDQQTKLTELERERHGPHFMGMGPGPFPGPGPH
ncbi:MAG: Spy/CpxP family protein refolding chaperone [Terriglobales bacterium]